MRQQQRQFALGSVVLLVSLMGFMGCDGKPTHTTPPPVTPVVTPPPPAPGSRRAVLVGINAYPGAALNGCVNDVIDIRSLVKTKYGFGDADIRFITDREATTANIWSALNWLVAEAKPGDYRLFWYSGHGAEYAGSDVSQEPDGKNQVICPVDFDWTEPHMIMDVQFNKLFKVMPTGVVFNWGSDSCHSGDLTRLVPPPGVKWRKYPIIPPNIATQLLKVAKKKGVSRGITGGELDVGYLSGCRYDQTSADTSSNGRPCGAMTHAFLVEIQKPGVVALPLVEVGQRLDLDLPLDQQPQVEGSRKTRPFLQP